MVACCKKPRGVTAAHEQVFLNMRLRKLQRDLNGTRQREGANKYHTAALVVLFVIVFGAGFGIHYSEEGDDFTFVVKFWQIVVMGGLIFLALAISGMLRHSNFGLMLSWMIIYWPLAAIVLSVLISEQKDVFSLWPEWLLIVFIILEVVTLITFLSIFYLYPMFISSAWFRTRVGAGCFWGLHALLPDFTIRYYGQFGFLGERQTCQYEGNMDSSTSLPNGRGLWRDDAYNGEILNGNWKDGKPVAPFLSRQYGTGDTFSGVAIAYFKATDDNFTENRFRPSNEDPPQWGIASVECSIHGEFYNHLPTASNEMLLGPSVVEKDSVAKMCGWLQKAVAKQEEKHELNTSVEVSTRDQRGLQVLGHVFNPTGKFFSKESNQVVIDVIHRSEEESSLRSSRFMPSSPHHGSIFSQDEVEEFELSSTSRDLEEPLLSPEEDQTEPNGDGNNEKGISKSKHVDYSQGDQHRVMVDFPYLEVKNWTRSPLKAALVYVPGFNSCLKNCLETLGQFMAMTSLSEHVYPICFSWPCGQVFSYLQSADISDSDRNKEYFLELMRGLYSAGIRRVHFMSHSMGVHTLLSAFADNPNDGSRSDVSRCFRLDSSLGNGSRLVGEEEEEEDLMICKSITMLNPDFPVESFVDHVFLSIRRVCNHITIVGDRNDQALFWSQLITSGSRYLGKTQPKVFETRNKDTEKVGFQLQLRIGRSIDLLCVPGEDEGTETKNRYDKKFYFKADPEVLTSRDEMEDCNWLDVDVIDTTNLDTNIANLRHSAFTVNPILLKDMEELIVTGRRAVDRSTLLFREGNIFGYCHAPSHVAM